MNTFLKITFFIFLSLNSSAMEISETESSPNFSENPSQIFPGENIIDASYQATTYFPKYQFTRDIENKRTGTITLFRSVDATAGLQITPYPRALWLEALFHNVIRPYNIYATKSAVEHNLGSKGNFSQYTSWTYSMDSVNLFGCVPGCLIFMGNFESQNLTTSPDNYVEKELLVAGTTKNFRTFLVTKPLKLADYSLEPMRILNDPNFIELTPEKLVILLNELSMKGCAIRRAFLDGNFDEIDFEKLFATTTINASMHMEQEENLEVYQSLYRTLILDLTRFYTKAPRAISPVLSDVDTTNSDESAEDSDDDSDSWESPSMGSSFLKPQIVVEEETDLYMENLDPLFDF